MNLKHLKNPFINWIQPNTNDKEKLNNLTDINLLDPLLQSRKQNSQLIGDQFFLQLNQKIQVLEEHHYDLLKQLSITPFSIILKNQKQITTINVNNNMSEDNNDTTNEILPSLDTSSQAYVYSTQENISTYKVISSLTKFDPSLIKSQIISYVFNPKNQINTNHFFAACELLENAFLSMGYLISKPQFKATSDKLSINLFYFKQTKNASFLIKSKLHHLIHQFVKFFNRSIQLNMTRTYKPQNENTILTKHLIINSYHGRFLKIISTLFKQIKFENKSYIHTFTATQYSLFPSFISGIKVRLGGRTIRQRIVPRKTVQSLQRGTLARTKALYVNKTQISHKTRRGAFTFTVQTGHVF